MARWITFDPHTAAELRNCLPGASIFEAPGRSALEYALNSSGPVVAVLPLNVGQVCALTVFRPRPAQARRESPRALRASGFLGLNDEVFFEDEESAPKNWWQRLWS